MEFFILTVRINFSLNMLLFLPYYTWDIFVFALSVSWNEAQAIYRQWRKKCCTEQGEKMKLRADKYTSKTSCLLCVFCNQDSTHLQKQHM